MSGVGAPAHLTAIQPQPLGTLVEAWGGSEQLARVLAALRGCLADDALPPLPAEVRTLMPGVTWGQVADTMRIAESALRPLGVDTPTSGATPATPPPRPPLATIQSATHAKELRAERSEHQSFKRQAGKDFTSLEVS